MINGAALNSSALNSNAGNGAGDATLLFQQNVIANIANASLFFQQTIADIGHAELLFDQGISNPIGNATLLFVQTIADVGQASLFFSQNVYDPALVAESWVNWDVSVIADGIDISSEIVGSLIIDAEHSAARVANFTVLLSGVVDIIGWAGKKIIINYIQNSGAVWRRFSGVIEHADYDVQTKTLACTCTDDLQRFISGYSKQQLLVLTGGFYSAAVFDSDDKGWDLLNNLLSTVSKSVVLNSNGHLIVSSLQNKAIADYTFDDNLILDDTLSVQLAYRGQLINSVDIEFNSRFNRLYQADRTFNWQYSQSFCGYFLAPPNLPTEDVINAALNDSEWHLNNINYTPLFPSGTYYCNNLPVLFANNFPEAVIGFNAKSSFRWSQQVTEKYTINVSSIDSINKFGKLTETISASVSIDNQTKIWGGKDDKFSALPVGFVQNIDGHFVKDDISSNDEVDSALNVLVNQAITTINQSHQQSSVTFQLPLSPFLEINQTIAVSDTNVTAKGIIKRFTETYNFDTAEPITDIELSISSGNSGMDIVNQLVQSPKKSNLQATNTSFIDGSILIAEHIGGLIGSPPEDDTWTGVIINNTASVTTNDPVYYYAEGIKIPFPAIDDKYVLNSDIVNDSSIVISVPENTLIITA